MNQSRKSTSLANVLSVLFLSFFSFCAIKWVAGPKPHDFTVPYNYAGDTLLVATLFKGISTEGSFLHLDNVGFPLGLDLHDIPFPFYLDYSLVWLLARLFGSNAGSLVNGYWALSVFLTALTAFYSFRLLRLRHSVAVAAAVGFAFLPHVFLRDTHHVLLTLYLIPPVALMAFLSGANRVSELLQRRYWPCLLCAVLTGFAHTYLPFMAALVLGFAALVRIGLHGWANRRVALLALMLPLLPSAGLLAGLTPTLLLWHQNPRGVSERPKLAVEADIYGLKLRHLLMPIPGHPIPLLARLSDRLEQEGFPLENENRMARLGSFAACGLCVLLALGIFRRSAGHAEADALLYSAAAISICLIAFSVVGGLGSFFSVFIFPDFRALNRISPYLGFAGILCGALVANEKIAKVKWVRSRMLLDAGCFLILPILMLLDQAAVADIRRRRPEDLAIAAEVDEALKAIHHATPTANAFLMLPPTPFIADAGRARMTNYEHARFYLQGNGTRVSWPTLDGREPNLTASIASESPGKLVESAALVGFDTVVVDTFGYDDAGREVLAGLKSALEIAPVVSSSGRWHAFSLQKANELVARWSESERAAKRHQRLAGPRIRFAQGFYTEEHMGPTMFRWIRKDAEMELVNPSNQPCKVRLEMEFLSGSLQSFPLTIGFPSAAERLEVSAQNSPSFSREFSLSPHGRTRVTFSYQGTPNPSPQDPRSLFVMVLRPRLTFIDAEESGITHDRAK